MKAIVNKERNFLVFYATMLIIYLFLYGIDIKTDSAYFKINGLISIL